MQELNHLPEEPFEPSPEFAALAAQFDKELSDAIDAADAIDREEAAVRAIDPADVTDADVKRIDKIRPRRIQAMRDELAVRKRMAAEYYRARYAERARARDAAIQEHVTATAEVKQALLDMGYIDGELPGTGRPCMIPMFWMNHPRVYRAMGLAEQLRNWANYRVDEEQNANRIRKLEQSIREAVGAAMAVA